MNEKKRIMAVDPGQKRTGVALSDPTGTIANPLEIVEKTSRESTADYLLELARDRNVAKIVVGQALHWDRSPSQQSKIAVSLASTIRKKTDIPVILWNEYGSTQTAQEARIAMGLSTKKRQQNIDHLAATVILQSYLDAQDKGSEDHRE